MREGTAGEEGWMTNEHRIAAKLAIALIVDVVNS